jgi:hypothetical protein
VPRLRPHDSLKQCKHPRSGSGIGRLSAAGQVEQHRLKLTDDQEGPTPKKMTKNLARRSKIKLISAHDLSASFWIANYWIANYWIFTGS